MNFVTSQQVISNVFTNTNTDTNLIKSVSIQQTQLNHLKPVLTEELYNLIESENDATNLSAVNQLLFDNYVVPAMYYFVKYDCMINIAVKSNSKGLNRGTGNFSQPSDNTDLGNVMASAFNEGLKILKNMTQYLQDNEDLYPTYERTQNVMNDVNNIGGIIY